MTSDSRRISAIGVGAGRDAAQILRGDAGHADDVRHDHDQDFLVLGLRAGCRK